MIQKILRRDLQGQAAAIQNFPDPQAAWKPLLPLDTDQYLSFFRAFAAGISPIQRKEALDSIGIHIFKTPAALILPDRERSSGRQPRNPVGIQTEVPWTHLPPH